MVEDKGNGEQRRRWKIRGRENREGGRGKGKGERIRRLAEERAV